MERTDFSHFHSPLKELFTLLGCRTDKHKLHKLLQEEPLFRQLDGETAQVAGVLMGVKDFMGERKLIKEEKYDMCEAIQEMMNDSWQNGIEQGIGVFIIDFQEEGYEKERIIKKLIRRFGLTEEQAKEYYEKYGTD